LAKIIILTYLYYLLLPEEITGNQILKNSVLTDSQSIYFKIHHRLSSSLDRQCGLGVTGHGTSERWLSGYQSKSMKTGSQQTAAALEAQSCHVYTAVTSLLVKIYLFLKE